MRNFGPDVFWQFVNISCGTSWQYSHHRINPVIGNSRYPAVQRCLHSKISSLTNFLHSRWGTYFIIGSLLRRTLCGKVDTSKAETSKRKLNCGPTGKSIFLSISSPPPLAVQIQNHGSLGFCRLLIESLVSTLKDYCSSFRFGLDLGLTDALCNEISETLKVLLLTACGPPCPVAIRHLT